MLCFCFLANVVEIFKNGKTAYHTRFDTEYSGPTIPFGAEIYYLPIAPKDKARTHQLGEEVLKGIFLGYETQAGMRWSGDLIIADWD